MFLMSSQVKKSGQCELLDKNHQYFQLFHCQQTQSLLITLYLAKIKIYLDIPFYGVYEKLDTDNTIL
jgi:hypothetical protein